MQQPCNKGSAFREVLECMVIVEAVVCGAVEFSCITPRGVSNILPTSFSLNGVGKILEWLKGRLSTVLEWFIYFAELLYLAALLLNGCT